MRARSTRAAASAFSAASVAPALGGVSSSQKCLASMPLRAASVPGRRPSRAR